LVSDINAKEKKNKKHIEFCPNKKSWLVKQKCAPRHAKT